MEGNEKSKPNKGFLNKGFLNKSVGNMKDDAGVSTPATAHVAASFTENKTEGSHELPKSYAATLQNVKQARKVNFRPLSFDNSVEGADLTLTLATVKEVNSRFANTLYGYFLGNRLAFPIVENYVKNSWAKFGIRKVMMNSSGFFFFKFETKAGMEQVMERGPWLIRSVPILLNIWTPNTNLTKQDITSVPVWVKLYDVPLAAYTEDGLSMIATKLGIPIMLDSHTSDMCLDSWGRNSFARALIQINSGQELRSNLVVAIPSLPEEGNTKYTKETVIVEYEWKPPRCSTCKVFGHSDNLCPKISIQRKVVQKDENRDDGFTVVEKKGGKPKQVEGIRLTKPKPNFVYRRKQQRDLKVASISTPGKTSVSNAASKQQGIHVPPHGPKVALKNSYDVLKSTSHDYGNASTSRVEELTPQVVDCDEDEAPPIKIVDTKGTTKQVMGEHVKTPEQTTKIDGETRIIGSECDYSDDDDEDEVYDLDANEISAIHRDFCKAMDFTVKGLPKK